MKKRKKNACLCAIFLLITLFFTAILSEGMKSTDLVPYITINGFEKEKKNSLDMVFIGASEVYSSYSPTMAWEEYGYTSYDLGSPGIPGSLYLPLLKETLRKQNPQVVVFEINGFLYNDEYYKREAKIRNVVDNMPLSGNKLETIQNLIDPENRMSYYLPILAYHSNWEHPGSFYAKARYKFFAFFHKQTNLKGFTTYSYTYQPTKDETFVGETELSDKSRHYLEELLAYCREQENLQVLFLRAPHYSTSGERQTLMNEIWQEIEASGFDYLDCTGLNDEIGIDPTTDFYNKEHLNLYGARKFTSWFGNYITTTYGIKSTATEETAKTWNQCAEKSNQLFDYVEDDIVLGIVRHYTEAAFYVAPGEAKEFKK